VRITGTSSEAEMVASFLVGELSSERFGPTIARYPTGGATDRPPHDIERQHIVQTAGPHITGASPEGHPDFPLYDGVE
jgi:hypothetical protein